MKAPHRSASWRLLILVVVLLLAAALPALSAQAEPTKAPVFAKPGPRIDPNASETAQAYRRLAAKNKAAAASAQPKQKAGVAKPTKPAQGKKTSRRAPAENMAAQPKQRAQAAAALTGDYTSSTPQTTRDNIAGDFRQAGYDQRMRVEGNQLTIRDPEQQGGKITSVTTDLEPAPDIIPFKVRTGGGWQSFPLSTWSQWASDKARTNSGGFEFLFDLFHINTVYLAEMDGYVYILGTQGSNGYNSDIDTAPVPNQYRVRIYKIRMDDAVNRCATAACAVATFDLPTAFNLDGSVGGFFPFYPRAVGPSSLAAGHVNGVGYLAVGLTDGGVVILDTNLNQTGGFAGMAVEDQSQTVPTALAWDPAGSGLLSVGVTSHGAVGYITSVNSQGVVTNGAGSVWTSVAGYGLIPTPITAAIWQPGDGTTMNAFGMSDWSVQVMQATNGQNTQTSAVISDTGSGIPTAINPIPRVPGSGGAGGPDLAISGQATSDVTNTNGTVVRWDPGTSTLSHLSITPNGGTSITGATSFDSWFPGLKQGRIQITNSSQEEISVSIKSSPDAGKGCWYAQDWLDAKAFPDQLAVAPGTTSKPFNVMGFLSSGASGNCFTTDNTGTKRAYLVISPTNRDADRQIVQLQIDSSLKVSLQDQAGSGSTTSSLSAKLGQFAAIGLWDVTVDSSDLPTPTAKPAVKAIQLTPFPSDNAAATSAVYKLTVQPLIWTVPGLNATLITSNSTSRLQAVIPPLVVQGSNDATNWTTVGSFLPTGAVNFDPAAGTLTTSKGTFYWENTAGHSYASLQVVAGTGQSATTSAPIPLSPSTPTPVSNATSLTLDPPQSGVTFSANGLDSYPLQLTVNLSKATSTDPAQSVYYRNDATGALITNLYTTDAKGDPVAFFGIQPDAGAYPNTVSSGRRTVAGQSTEYAVSDSGTTTVVSANVWTAAIKSPYQSTSGLKVTASPSFVQATQTSASSFSLQNCAYGQGCVSAEIAPMGTNVSTGSYRAAIYQAGPLVTDVSPAGPPQLGVLFGSLAINDDTKGLPLTWTTSTAPQVATSAVSVNYSTDAISVTTPLNLPSGANQVQVSAVARGLFIMASITN